jgi:hypothetical protein
VTLGQWTSCPHESSPSFVSITHKFFFSPEV